MKILLIHNYYQQSGGEDNVLDSERTLLEHHGHQVILFTVNNDGIQGIVQKMRVAWETPYSSTMKLTLTQLLFDEQPDIVHVHNFFPLITPAVYDACWGAGVPVIQTLHNFRLICPGGLLMKNGKICEKCLCGSSYRSVLYGCYRGSRLGTLAVARMLDMHKKMGTWLTKVDRFITMTKFARLKFIAAGFPADKIVVKPNFVYVHDRHEANCNRNGALFVGRLSQEKGVMTLLDAWKGMNPVLRIIGDGPLLDEIRAQSSAHVEVLGRRTLPSVFDAMASSQFLVMPSEWYETFGLVIIEAFSCGLPVIASRLGAMAELIEDGVTGLLFTPGDSVDIAEKVRWAFDHPAEMLLMGERARKVCEEKYSPLENYRQLMAIYNEALSARSVC